MDILKLIREGGPVMWPLVALSILSLTVILWRLWFWMGILSQERQIVNRVLDAARSDWAAARSIAKQASNQPIGRFLYAPLSQPKSDLETFRLALEATAEDELAGMRRGEKLLESVIALAPLLGLLGTVLGLIQSLGNLRIGDFGTEATANVPAGIGQALISTATGLVVAIVSLVFYRLFQGFLVNQVKIFRRAGNDLELLYRQFTPDWNLIASETSDTSNNALPPAIVRDSSQENFTPPRKRGKNRFSEPPEGAESNSVDPEK